MRAFVFALCAVAAVSSLRIPNPVYNKHWESFKSVHGKQYGASNDEVVRRFTFDDNMFFIDQFNKVNSTAAGFKLAPNQFTDMTNEEFKNVLLRTGYRNNTAADSVFSATGLEDLPTTVDWRDKGYVTPVKNQGSCGSCWAFSTTGSLEGQHFKATGKLVSLSEQNLVDCSTAEGNQGCNGGLMDQAFDYIKKVGIDTEASYPYTGKDGKCTFDANSVGANLKGYVDVKTGDEAALKEAVATIGPISVAIDASSIFFQFYHSGVYNPWFCSSTKLDHGVLAVGYGTESSKDYWLVKNSWGASWGMSGYIKMIRNKSNRCGIATSASYPTV